MSLDFKTASVFSKTGLSLSISRLSHWRSPLKIRLEFWYCTFFVYYYFEFPALLMGYSQQRKSAREIQNSVNNKTENEFKCWPRVKVSNDKNDRNWQKLQKWQKLTKIDKNDRFDRNDKNDKSWR